MCLKARYYTVVTVGCDFRNSSFLFSAESVCKVLNTLLASACILKETSLKSTEGQEGNYHAELFKKHLTLEEKLVSALQNIDLSLMDN